jgi:hypothetical protein
LKGLKAFLYLFQAISNDENHMEKVRYEAYAQKGFKPAFIACTMNMTFGVCGGKITSYVTMEIFFNTKELYTKFQ